MTDQSATEPSAQFTPASSAGLSRIHVFIDNANMDITMTQKARRLRQRWNGFDWTKLPDWLVGQAADLCEVRQPIYTGTHAYVSYDPQDPDHDGRVKWMDWLDLQRGMQVVRKELRSKDPQRCRAAGCGFLFRVCPKCDTEQRPRVEKGIDTAMVTDMMCMAWDRVYDVAVLVSSDSDFAPVVETLEGRGLRIVQAGFPPTGMELRKACWASFDMYAPRAEFERPARERRPKHG